MSNENVPPPVRTTGQGWVYILPVAFVLILGALLFGPKLKRMSAQKDSTEHAHPRPEPVQLDAAERAEGFGGAKWGMSAAEVEAATGGGMAARQGMLMGREVWLSYNYTPAGQLYEVAAVFPAGEDWSAFMEVEASSHFSAQFGSPQLDSAQDARGAGISRRVWSRPHTLIEAVLDKPADGPASLKVLFRSPALAEMMHQQDVEAELLKAGKTLKGFKE